MFNDEVIINSKYARLVKSRYRNLEASDTNPDEIYKESEEISVSNMLTTNDFFDKINKNNLYKQILPRNCRYMDVNSRGTVVVIEEDPCIRTVSLNLDLKMELKKLQITGKLEEYGFSNLLDQDPPYTLSLSFPYIVYIFFIRRNGRGGTQLHTEIFYRLSPLTSLGDYLLSTNLLNVNDTNIICLNESNFNTNNIEEICNKCINSFWFKRFNHEYNAKYQLYKDHPLVGDPFTWAYYSAKDPTFVFGMDWIKTKYNLREEIYRFYYDNLGDENINIKFDSVMDPFKQYPVNQSMYEVSESCFSVCLDTGYILSVGDEITYEDKKYYVYSFIYENDYKYVKKIKLEDPETSEITEVDFNEDYFLNKMRKEKEKLKSIDVNGTIIHINDIVKLDPATHMLDGYFKVEKIRLSRDGNYEVKIGQYMYLAKNLKILDKFDTENIVIDGFKLEKEKEYNLLHRLDPKFRLYELVKNYIYERIQIRSSTLDIIFTDKNYRAKYSIDLSIEDKNSRNVQISNIEEFSDVSCFSLGTDLLFGNYKLDLSNKIIVQEGSNSSKSDNKSNEEKFKEITDKILINNDELHIPGLFHDINFKIGDLVVVSDWITPQNMLKIRRIKGFEVDNESFSINMIITGNEENSILKVPYIKIGKDSESKIKRTGRILLGKVRKVSLEYNGIKAGSKIRAKVAKIPGFPKKDSNQIIAFLTDTGTPHPMILCSNYLTLWANNRTLEKFDIINQDSTKWSKLKINDNPDINKIKSQIGDLYLHNGFVYYLNTQTELLGLNIEYAYRGLLNYRLNKWAPTPERFGYLEPRMSNDDYRQAGLNYGIPNFHGGYFLYGNGPFNIRKNWEEYV